MFLMHNSYLGALGALMADEDDNNSSGNNNHNNQ
jgi:hypothetical protein